ncbi:hypothetical protein SFC23_17770 [Shouchella clausii]|uniref:restriction endonuclease subunit S n=1 Tax=Shouchella clausii TaxID=79880 RepID=UPI003982DF26
MRSEFKRIGEFIRKINVRNTQLNVTKLMGINIDKFFMPSVANTVGTDMAKYQIVKKGQFACNRMHVGRDKRLPVALSRQEDIIVSPAYDVFEVIDQEILNPEYLMMWFLREEFDRNAWFYTDADVRGGLAWEDFCNIRLPVPSIIQQEKAVKAYKIIDDKISLNNNIIKKLEETIHCIYKQLFVTNKSISKSKVSILGRYIETNPQLSLKRNTVSTYVGMKDITTTMGITGFIKRDFRGGSKFQNNDTLLARITPCLENGKTAFVDILEDGEIAAGSTEFIVMRGKENISPYWVYCLARDKNFRSYAISSMVGSSGRQRVHEEYLDEYVLPEIDYNKMEDFHNTVDPLFKMIKLKNKQSKKLLIVKSIILSNLVKLGVK